MSSHTTIDFWGIGAQKSGTTWLYQNLKALPEFELPRIKEIHYFDRSIEYPSPNKLAISSAFERMQDKNYRRRVFYKLRSTLNGGDRSETLFYLRWFFGNYHDNWYLSLFKKLSGLKGEITPSYAILTSEDIKKMYQICPHAKLILLLRNPIERAWSHFRHSKKRINNFVYEDVSTEEILAFIQGDAQVLRSDYARTIHAYTSVFPKEQLLVGFFDAIQDSPNRLLNEITQFIGADSSTSIEKLSLDKVINKSPKSTCPQEVQDFLKEMYHDPIKQLADQYGSYFCQWYNDTYGQSYTYSAESLTPTFRIL